MGAVLSDFLEQFLFEFFEVISRDKLYLHLFSFVIVKKSVTARAETNGIFPTAFGTKEWGKAIQRMTIVGVWSVLVECIRSFMVL